MILDILTIVGLTLILTTSQIFKPFREWLNDHNKFLGELVDCPMCAGVWVGALYYICPESILIDTLIINIKINFNIFVKEIFRYSGIGSISSYILYLIIQRLKLK